MNFGQWLGLLCLVLSLYILWQIHQLLLLIFTAVVLATAFNSLVRRLQRLGIRRGLAVVLTVTLTLVISGLFFWLIVPPFISEFQKLVQLLPAGFAQVRRWIDILNTQLPGWFPELPNLSGLIQQLQPLVVRIFGNFFTFFSTSLAVLLQLLLVIVLALMLLANPQPYRRAFLKLFPSFYRRRADEILSECEVVLGNWLGAIVLNSLFIGTLSGLGLWALQVQLVLAHALLAGLLNFIPNIGPTLSLVFPLTIALLDTPWKAGGVVALYVIIQQVESYWLTPMVMARQVSLLPALTLFAQIFFASFFGFLGLLLALPLAVVAKTWLHEVLIKDVLNNWHRNDQALPLTLQPATDAIAPNDELGTSL